MSACALAMTLAAATPRAGETPSITAHDVAVLSRALAFLQPPAPGDARVMIVYAAGDAASRRDGEAIQAVIGDHLEVGGVALKSVLVESGALATVELGRALFIVAAGGNGAAVLAASRARHILCVTGEVAAVRAGTCMMSIVTEPRPDIVVNHDAATQAGLSFKTAFRMMISEI